MSDPRVFVGTLHSGEGDFERCCNAIKSQRGVLVTHHVISGLSELEAHNALWTAWRESEKDHDVFVKVDADTVLRDDSTLQTICDTLASTGATGLQAPLHDYMTDSLIDGLNAYTKRVVFLDSQDPLYCDRGLYVGNTHIVKDVTLPPLLRPAGFHCHHTTGLQAFRYGLHRALKTQNSQMQLLVNAWRRHNDRLRGLAVIGVMVARRFSHVQKRKSDYTEPALMAAYADAEARYDEYVAAINVKRFELFD